KEVPSATDQTVFYDDQSKRFSITISKPINTHSKTSYSVQNIQTQAFEKELDLDLSQFNESPDVLIYKTKGRANNQVVFEIEPFVVKNNKLHTVTGFTIVPKTTALSQIQRFQQFSTVATSHPTVGFRFEVDKTGIYKITGKFLSDLGMSISNVDPKTLKIYGKGGQMISLINSETNDFNYGFSENPLQLVGMDDGVIGEEDYILFYAYGSDEWNSDSQTAVNLYHDKSHYVISHGGSDGLRVSVNSPQPVIEDAQTAASVDLHFEEDLVNVAQMGRKWFGDRFLHNATKDYPFQLVNRAGSTPIDVKVAAAGSSSIANQLIVRVESESTSINFSSTQVLTKAAENKATLLLNPSSNDININLQYDGAGLSSSIAYLDYIRLTYQRTLDGGDGQFGIHTEPSASYKASNTDAVWELHTNGNISIYHSNNGNVYFGQSDTTERFHLHISNDVYTPKRSDYGDVFTSPQLRERLANEAEYIIVTHDDYAEEANKLAAHHRTHSGLKSVVLTLSEIYDDFSAGNIDIVAIRNAVRYAYLNNSEDNKPKYLCLFGDTSYDYKDRVPNN
ncbi:MAG: C25 family cysteine peptidase, partial [Bacteroidota bacterium]|nr:C25 family cysteine peptidase [Bacteroidota bacterium]